MRSEEARHLFSFMTGLGFSNVSQLSLQERIYDVLTEQLDLEAGETARPHVTYQFFASARERCDLSNLSAAEHDVIRSWRFATRSGICVSSASRKSTLITGGDD